MPGWMNHKLESSSINNLIYANEKILISESEEELRNLLMKMEKKKSEKADLKLNIQKTNIMAPVPSLHGKDGENWKQ